MKFFKKYFPLILSLFLVVGYQSPTFHSLTIQTPTVYQQKIFTTSTFADVKNYIDKDTLLVSDIDLTLVREYLPYENGSLHSFQSGLYSLINKFLYKKLFTKYLKQLVSKVKNLGIIEPKREIKRLFKRYLKTFVDSKMKILWSKLEPKINYKLMEENSPQIIKNLQKSGNKIICFTAREWSMKDATRKDLLKVNIDAAINTIYNKLLIQQPIGNNYGFGFDKGILSLIRSKYATTKTQKGRILLSFFDAIGYTPKKVLFIDNRLDNVQEVVEALNKRNIPVVGLWYKFHGYIKNPVLLENDLKVLDSYFGQGWSDIKIKFKKAVGFVKENFTAKSTAQVLAAI